MKKLILLNEIRKEKNNKLLTLSELKIKEEEYSESYITFKKKFNCFSDKKESNDINNGNIGKIKNEKNINVIIKRIFSLSNYVLLINFINSIFNDALSPNTKIKCFSNELIMQNDSNNNIKILAQDEYRKFEYKIQLQTKDYDNIGIMISKNDLTNTGSNIINFNKKKKEYEIKEGNNESFKEGYTQCMIVLNSNIDVPEVCDFKFDLSEQNTECKVKIVKSWKYDFKQLFERNMYLLFPIKVIDLKKRLIDVNMELVSKDFIKDEILKFFKDMNRYLNKAKDSELITDKDINECNLIAVELFNNLIEKQNDILVDIKVDIEATLKDIVV